MDDYLTIMRKFVSIQEIEDFVNDVRYLRHYNKMNQFDQMQDHIKKVMLKYRKETLMWNAVNTERPISTDQKYRNAEHFLQYEGAMLLRKNVPNYPCILLPNEVAVINNILNLFSPKS